MVVGWSKTSVGSWWSAGPSYVTFAEFHVMRENGEMTMMSFLFYDVMQLYQFHVFYFMIFFL